MWYTDVPDFPFGKKEVRLVLVIRGLGGMVGVYGFYCTSGSFNVLLGTIISSSKHLTPSVVSRLRNLHSSSLIFSEIFPFNTVH